MRRMKTFWMVMGLALIAGTLMAGLTTAVYAQGGFGVVSGTVLDPTGKPYPGVEIIAKNQESGQTFDVKTDGKGHYSMAGMPGGTYTVDLKDKDKIVYQTGFKLAGGTSPVFDVNLKEIFEKDKGANAEAEAKRAEAEKAFQSLKAHYDAGLQAIDAMKAAQAEMAKIPKDQKEQLAAAQQKISDAGSTAGCAEAEARGKTGPAKNLRAAQRCADRRHQGAPETVVRAGILLAAGGKRVARRRPQDPRQAAGRARRCRDADRSRLRGSPAAQIGGYAALVPAARGSEGRSAQARPYHRPGKSRRRDLSRKRQLQGSRSLPGQQAPTDALGSVPCTCRVFRNIAPLRTLPAEEKEGAVPCGLRWLFSRAWEPWSLRSAPALASDC